MKGKQYWLNSYDCHYVVSMKERKSIGMQENENIARMYRETNNGEILMIIASWFLRQKNTYVQEFTERSHRIVINSFFISQ